MLHIRCNIGTRDLPGMYALSPQACGPRALNIHIRQITCTYVTTITYCILLFNILYACFTVLNLLKAAHIIKPLM